MAGSRVHDGPVRAIAVSFCLLALFGSYCQMAPAVVGATRGWEAGSTSGYSVTETLLFREAATTEDSGRAVGFRFTARLYVTALWKHPSDQDSVILKIELRSPQLWIKSRKAPKPDGFVEHSSGIETVSKKPILLLWRNGEIKSLYLDPSESVSSANLKRGLASLFQYRTLDDELEERDASGLCLVKYSSLNPTTVVKEKYSCRSSSLPPRKTRSNRIFDVNVDNFRESVYELTPGLLPKVITGSEVHRMSLAAMPDVGSVVSSMIKLETLPESPSGTKNVIDAESVGHAVALIEPQFRETSIELQLEPVSCPETGCPKLEQAVEENRDNLEDSSLGTAKSASAFLKLIPLVKDATIDELTKLLKSARYRGLKSQLLDVYGSSSTRLAHEAAMKALKQDESGDDTERYLWALSLSPSPDAGVFKDILRRSEETMQNDKVSETMALTAAAMAWRDGSKAVLEKARVSLEIGLDSCTGEACKLKFLRALRNLKSKDTVPVLLKHAFSENRAISVASWRALATLDPVVIGQDVKIAAKRVFYQLGGPKRDSSARTLALDVILRTGPTVEDLRGLVEYLAYPDPAYEVKKYLSQRLKQISEDDQEFREKLRQAFEAEQDKVRNYHVQAQKGLSTAFTRSFFNSRATNGFLVTVQEVNSGLLKRGIVDVVLETNTTEQAVFSLGLFAGGLGSFVSSSTQEEEAPAEEEVATAGMEIDILGVGVRPFVFFAGQGELMGHVWSGTASERTPAFQVLAQLHDYAEHLALASGFVAELDVRGAVSFDLAGQIQLSLWSRNAQSLVEMDAGIAIQGGTRLRTDFVQSKSEFSATTEPRLELATDVDFSGPVSLCMRLAQPNFVLKRQVYNIERIAGSRHKLRKTRRTKSVAPARSYMLNRKNNEMCSKVFS